MDILTRALPSPMAWHLPLGSGAAIPRSSESTGSQLHTRRQTTDPEVTQRLCAASIPCAATDPESLIGKVRAVILELAMICQYTADGETIP